LKRMVPEETPILGEPVSAFEREFATQVGTAHAVGVGSGTDALVLSLRSLGIGDGDEVITAANTFAATVTAILTVGARPVLVDPDPDTLTLGPDGLVRALTGSTRAVIPVHLYGRLCPMPPILEVCAQHDVSVIEDAAQAHGARDGRAAGAFGRLGCFSFHPSKNLGAFGDGGAVTTNDSELAGTIRELRNLGQRRKHEFIHVAPNSKLDSLQAVVLRVKLRYLDRWNTRRREIAAFYARELAVLERDGVLELPELPRGEEHAFHLFAVHSDRRDELRQFLKEHGINAGVHYPVPPHLQPMTRGLGYGRGDFPVAEASARRELSLPIAPELDDAQLHFVCKNVHGFFHA
ncbi:MAG: DegT/DnrJ/EryC1/StrS family aminotransferase, partial [Planctomycetota bacterium]